MQRLREVDREMKYEEYAGREGDIVMYTRALERFPHYMPTNSLSPQSNSASLGSAASSP